VLRVIIAVMYPLAAEITYFNIVPVCEESMELAALPNAAATTAGNEKILE
jgi:hypothetical protein